MKFIKGLFTFVGAIVVIGFVAAFFAFDLGTRIGQVAKLDSNALPEYMKMFDKVLTTGDPAKGMIRKMKMEIPEGMSKKEAADIAVEAMADAAEMSGTLEKVGFTNMNRGPGAPLTYIVSFCNRGIADKFLRHSGEFIGFMPCRVGIVEDPESGDLYVYTMSMELMINGGYELSPELLELANGVRAAMYNLVEVAAKAPSEE
ncbi:MAG: hypothetical protein RL113_400 [Pseudomonadota bacterium]|jgi:hypothetical protein